MAMKGKLLILTGILGLTLPFFVFYLSQKSYSFSHTESPYEIFIKTVTSTQGRALSNSEMLGIFTNEKLDLINRKLDSLLERK